MRGIARDCECANKTDENKGSQPSTQCSRMLASDLIWFPCLAGRPRVGLHTQQNRASKSDMVYSISEVKCLEEEAIDFR